jgi:anaerobic selenocysteine-containing dehydrogenase
VHNYGSLLFGPPLLRTLRTKNRFSATSVDQLPHHLAALFMFGHPLLLPIPDIDRTEFFLILGANPLASNGSMMTAPDFRGRLKRLRKRGGEVVLIDPRRTETAKIADRHLFIRPGTDVYLLLALLNVILSEHLERPGRLEKHCKSLESIRTLVADFPPERVAPVTGIEAEAMHLLARRFASAPAAVCYGRLGVSTQEFGALCHWLINVLNAVTGNLDSPGGAMFTRPAVDVLKSTGRGHLGRWKSRVRGLPEFGNELPVAVLAEEIFTAGPGQVRALLTVAGNPVLSTPNGSQLERALPGLEFMAAVDFYINETTRHAHIILPPTAPLEHDHYDLVFNLLAVRNTAKYSRALLEPAANTRHDWQIFSELQQRLDGGSMKIRIQRSLAAKLGPRGLLNLGLRFGPHGSGLRPFGRGLTLRKLKRSVHGLDLGPLKPCLPERLRNADRQIELAPQLYREEIKRLHLRLNEGSTQTAVDHDLLLIGRRHVRSNNSWMHNFPRLMRGKERCTLLMHPDDAAHFDLENQQMVEVKSRVGRVAVPLEISDEVMRGVVSLPHGWGHHRDGVRLTTATDHPGASLNDLTDELEVDQLCGTAALNGIRVIVRPTDILKSQCQGVSTLVKNRGNPNPGC